MFQVTNTAFNGATSQSGPMLIPYPGTPAEGDLLFLFIGRDSSGNITIPTGWTQLHNQQNSNRGIILWKRADGTESGDLSVTVNNSEQTDGIMMLVHSTTTTAPQFIGNYGYSSTSNCPNLVIPFPGVDMLFIAGLAGSNRGTTAATTYPAGYDDNQLTATVSPNSTSSSYTGCAVATRSAIAGENEDPGAFSFGGSINSQMATIAVYEFDVASIDPNTKRVDELGNSYISIIGDVSGGAAVEFDGVAVDPGLVNIYDAQTIQVITPVSAVAGAVDVKVIDATTSVEATLANGFTYLEQPPEINSVTPTGSIVDETGTMTIKGVNFRSGAIVEIDGVLCADIVVVDSETITATFPAQSEQKSAILTVENDDAQIAFSNFFYMSQTEIKSPESGVASTFSVSGIRYLK